MLTWDELVKKYITKHSDAIRKATQPLRDHFGIGYFTHHRIDAEGNYSVLVDRPDWAEYYVSTQVYQKDPFLGLPEQFNSGILSIRNSHQYMHSFEKKLHMDAGTMLIQKGEDDVQFFGFFGSEKTSALPTLSLNHPEILYSFADHFKSQFQNILTQMDQEKASITKLKGNNSLTCWPICPELDESSLIAYYSDLGFTDEVTMLQKLSKRERQCFGLLLEGKSAKETAALLGLTRRTVESYFETIKGKLSCWSKQQLFSKAKRLKAIGLAL